jgi:mono/diheme cytochrome c family protein
MSRSTPALAILCLLVLTGPRSAFAQDGAPADQQKLGARLFNQSCVLCHKNPQITAGQYGPVLSTATLGGKEDVMRDVIGNGTPRMPGFKTQYTPAQIDGIVAYIKTIPAPAAAVPAAHKGGPGEAD